MLVSANVKAQTFFIEPPVKKNSDNFSLSLINILNDAPSKFSHIKGKLLAKTDTIHLQSQIFQVKIFIPGSVIGRLVMDSTIYTEYFFGEYESPDEAREQLELINNKIIKALNKRIVVLKNEYRNDANSILEHKFAYTLHSGFFHYNMSLQANKVISRNTYRVVFQVYSGKPNYYNWIMKNEPVGSFNFIKFIKNNVDVIDKLHTANACPVDIPPFNCVGILERNDTTFIHYNKTGFDGLANAKSEFDAFFGSIRSGLGTDYIYFTQALKPPIYKRVAFVKFDDVDKPKRKTIYLSLLDKPVDSNSIVIKKEYQIMLSISY
jgi:hypothetical protein